MDSNTLKDAATIATPFLLFALGVVVAVVGYLIAGLINDLKEKNKDLEGKNTEAKKKAEQVERELLDFKAVLPKQYVLKDDYIRTISVFEKKLDDIGKEIKIFTGRKNAES